MAYGLIARGTRDFRRSWDRISHRALAKGRFQSENPAPSRLGRAKRRFWFTGENVRPPIGDWDLYFSFDLDPLGGRNLYFPIWWESVGVLGPSSFSFTRSSITVNTLMQHRNIPRSPRRKFLCAFIGNPTPMRLHALKALSVLGDVDTYGRAVGRPVPDKWAIAKDYRYMLSFENDLYPGYVTEKVFEAWSCGTIPLWWGSDPAGYVNPKSLINLADLDSIDELVARVADLEADSSSFEAKLQEPILLRPPDLQDVYCALTRATIDL